MPDKLKNLLFDLDGTIIDPKEGITKSIQYALRKLNFDRIPSSDELTWCIGPPLIQSFLKLLENNDENLAKEGVDYYRKNYSVTGIYQCRMYDGIKESLQDLSKRSKLFLATSKPTVFAKQILEMFNISSFFKGIYGAEFDGRFPRKADVIAHLLETEKINPSESLMIGDRKYDMIGAKANNMKSCGVLWGYGSRKEITEAGASIILENPCELLNLQL